MIFNGLLFVNQTTLATPNKHNYPTGLTLWIAMAHTSVTLALEVSDRDTSNFVRISLSGT